MPITPERLEQIRLAVEKGYHQYLAKRPPQAAAPPPKRAAVPQVGPSPLGRKKKEV